MTGEPLLLAQAAELAPLLAARWPAGAPPETRLADPWFANLYLFRQAHDWRWRRGDWPCISGRAYDGARLLLPLFDLSAAPLHALQALLQGHDAFGPLSDAQVARLDPALFSSHTVRDEADYLYRADHFRQYRGRLLQKKRNLVKQLRAEHVVTAEPYHAGLAAEAAKVLQVWLHDKAKAAGDADDGPCREALALADGLGFDGTLYRIEGRAVGFVLAEAIAPGVSVMRFAKGLDAYKGLYPHMFQQYCQARPALGWLNFEQDLGAANFRQTKQSYQPVALLAKHRVRLR